MDIFLRISLTDIRRNREVFTPAQFEELFQKIVYFMKLHI